MAKQPIKVTLHNSPAPKPNVESLENVKAPAKTKKKMSAAIPGAVGGAAVGFAVGNVPGAVAGAAVGTVGGYLFDRWKVYTGKK